MKSYDVYNFLIGDWVNCVICRLYHNHICQIESKCFEHPEEVYTGIVLTNDIIEKNGFKKYKYDDNTIEAYDINSYICIVDLSQYEKFGRLDTFDHSYEIRTHDVKGDLTRTGIFVDYIHEFQHILRDCGIKDFKYEDNYDVVRISKPKNYKE